jgi:hypothetical protein
LTRSLSVATRAAYSTPTHSYTPVSSSLHHPVPACRALRPAHRPGAFTASPAYRWRTRAPRNYERIETLDDTNAFRLALLVRLQRAHAGPSFLTLCRAAPVRAPRPPYPPTSVCVSASAYPLRASFGPGPSTLPTSQLPLKPSLLLALMNPTPIPEIMNASKPPITQLQTPTSHSLPPPSRR